MRIHRGIKFHQAKWLALYINLNNQMRTMATDEFSKGLYKLLNNAVFGKFLESLRKHRNFILTQSLKQIRKLIRKPHFKNRVILNERTNLCLIEMGKTSVVFDKFIQAGAAILDLSKAHMWEFHYETMKAQIFPNERITLLYKDTDSLTYNIRVPSLTERLLPYKAHFDFSEYPEDHPLFDIANKKVLGMMKDEVKGKMMTEFCALKAKMYSFIVTGERECKKAKGVRKNVVQKTLAFQDYIHSLRSGSQLYRDMSSIRSYNQQIYTIEQKKIALSTFDDKRCVLEDEIRTLAWGHYNIPREEDLIYLLNFQSSESNEEMSE